METIRGELVQKYIALGHSEEYAVREVNYFLEDAERSKQYVEMRRIAMARGNDLGIEDYVPFIAAFLVGMLGSWVLNSLQAIHSGTNAILILFSTHTSLSFASSYCLLRYDFSGF